MAMGAKAGATFGTAFGPGVGTLIGLGAGTVFGGLMGYMLPRMMVERGGPASMSGTAMVGEAGPEMLSVPRGAYVTSNAMMRHGVTPPGASAAAATNATKGATINMYMDGKKISSAVMARINEENNIVMA